MSYQLKASTKFGFIRFASHDSIQLKFTSTVASSVLALISSWCCRVYLRNLLLLLISVITVHSQKNDAFCTPDEAIVDGNFNCFESCEAKHIDPNTGLRYCLSYFPDNMQCPMQPFDREAILSCAGQYGPEDQNHWVVYIGGSNNFFEFKTTLDMLLETPLNSIYSPQVKI